MKRSILALMIGFALMVPSLASAAPPQRAIPYSGKLELDGEPVTEEVPMTFRLFDVLTGGSELFKEDLEVAVVGGAFSVVLGVNSVNPLPDPVFTAARLFVDVTVYTTPLTPRQQVFASPQAVRADTADVLRLVGASVINGGTVHISSIGRIYLLPGNSVHIGDPNQATPTGRLIVDGEASVVRGKTTVQQLDATGVGVSGNITASGQVHMGWTRNECYPTTYQTYNCHGEFYCCPCPAGQRVVGGGGSCPANSLLSSTRPWGHNSESWAVRCGTDFHGHFQFPTEIYAICARIAP